MKRILLILLLSSSLFAEEKFLLESIPVNLKKGTFTLYYHYKPENKNIVKRYLQLGADYLVQLEKFFNHELKPPKEGIHVYDKGDVNKGFQEIQAGMGGINPMNNAISPGLFLHELGHFFFNEDHYPKWLSEGGASYAGFFLAKTNRLKLNKEEMLNIIGLWISWSDKWKDVPVTSCYGDGGANYQGNFYRDCGGYAKSFYILMLLHAELGDEKFSEFLLNAWNNSSNTEEKILQELETVKSFDWKEKLQGWAYKGNYNWFNKDSIHLDSDLDGLTDILERILGTNPDNPDSDNDGYSDRAEYLAGTSYIDANDFPQNTGYPVIDGIAETLAISPEFVIEDPEGDSSFQADISKIEVYKIKNRNKTAIYLRAYFFKKQAKPAQHSITIRTLTGENHWIFNGWGFLSQPTFGSLSANGIEKSMTYAKNQIDLFSIEVFECILFPADLGIKGDFFISYTVGDQNGKEPVVAADASKPYLFESNPKFSLNASFEENSKKNKLTSVLDLENDNAADNPNLDIKNFYGLVENGNLYLGTSFYKEVGKQNTSVVTIQFLNEKGNILYMYQFNGGGLVGFFKSDKWEGKPLPTKNPPFAYLNKDFIMVFPISTFPKEISNPDTFRMRVVFSGEREKKFVFSSDESPILDVKRK